MSIQKNQEYIVDIIDKGYEGEGIAKINDYIIFIPQAIKGEKCKILILKTTTSHGFGKILEILQIGFAFLNELFVSVKLSGVEDDAPCEGMEVLIKKIKDILESKMSLKKRWEALKLNKEKLRKPKNSNQ